MTTEQAKEALRNLLHSEERPTGRELGYVLRRALWFFDKLRAYEKSGLEPEQVADLARKVQELEGWQTRAREVMRGVYAAWYDAEETDAMIDEMEPMVERCGDLAGKGECNG